MQGWNKQTEVQGLGTDILSSAEDKVNLGQSAEKAKVWR